MQNILLKKKDKNSVPLVMKIDGFSKQSFDFNSFNTKLERHISDVKRNKGYLSKGVSTRLGRKQQETSAFLAASDPGALNKYSALTSTLRYDRKARFVNAVNQASQTHKAINTAVQDGEKLKSKMDEIVKLYEENQKALDDSSAAK